MPFDRKTNLCARPACEESALRLISVLHEPALEKFINLAVGGAA